MTEKTGKEVECIICKKQHYRQKHQLREDKRYFCSVVCKNQGHSKLLTKHEYGKVKCPECGKEFQQHWKGPKKFCSVPCNSRHNLLIVNSKEPKKKGTRPEKELTELLQKYDIEFEFQKWVPWKKGWKKWYDFYIPNQNLLIEVDGTYWHGKDKKTSELNNQQWNTRKNDRLKNYLAKERGYKLVRIWSCDISSLSYEKLKEIIYE